MIKSALRPTLILASTLCLALISTLFLLSASQLQADEIESAAQCQDGQPLSCSLQTANQLSHELNDLQTPTLVAPAAPTPIRTSSPLGNSKVVTYDVTTRGPVTSDLAVFKQQAQQTFDDPRGWKQLGVTFAQVASGGHFTLVLATADQLPQFSPFCSSAYSCRVGRYVIINQDRWEGATPSWNAANGSIRDYRHMVINHETGHWLGHGHSNCPAAGQAAPVMQQQSIDLQGCSFNPWPTSGELFSPTLGL